MNSFRTHQWQCLSYLLVLLLVGCAPEITLDDASSPPADEVATSVTSSAESENETSSSLTDRPSSAPPIAVEPPEPTGKDLDVQQTWEKVLAAYGGRDQFEKSMTGSLTSHYQMFQNIPYVLETREHFVEDQKLLRETTKTDRGEPKQTKLIFDGQTMWTQQGEEPPSIRKQRSPFVHADPYRFYRRLQDSADAKTSKAQEVTLAGTRLIEIAQGDGERSYFDPNTHLLVMKIETTTPQGSEPAVTTRSHYRKHENVDGLMFPMIHDTYRDGKLFSRMQYNELDFQDNLDESLFQIPSDASDS